MSMNEDWDAIADDASEWSEPMVIAGTNRPEAVLSVRLSAEIAEEVRTLARNSGLKVGTYLRELIETSVGNRPGEVIYLRARLDASKTRSTSTDVQIVSALH
jgi:predicted DNA-binding protein